MQRVCRGRNIQGDSRPHLTLVDNSGVELHDDRVSGAGTVREAFNMLSRRDARQAGEAIQELLDAGPADLQAVQRQVSEEGPTEGAEAALVQSTTFRPATNTKSSIRVFTDPAKCLLHESFLQWAPRYSGKKFNLIHCDFPYGIGVFGGQQGSVDQQTTYWDTKDEYQ